jgi:chromosome segregation ATPase
MFPSATIETRLALVEKRLIDNNESFRGFSNTIDKLTEISGSLREIIAVHENRLVQREKSDVHIYELIEKRTQQFDRGIEKANERAEELNKQVQELLRNELNEQHKDLKTMLDGYREDQKEFNNTMEEKLEDMGKDGKEELKSLSKRVEALERWRWIMIGAGFAIGLLTGKMAELGPIISHLFAS